MKILKDNMGSIKFEILVNESFKNFCVDPKLSPVDNKWLLTLVNDFELSEWRYERFLDYIWNNIAETALSKKERDAILMDHNTIIRRSAQNLRLSENDDIGRGSEIAEILLYAIMRDYYHALSVVPKIFYKQNVQDNVKGADSVHIVLTEDKTDFTLWLGEAKFYKSLSSEDLNRFIASVKDTLNPDKIKKENSIITDISEIDLYDEITDELKASIKNTLKAGESLDSVITKIHIPILILHQCGKTSSATELSDSYKEKIIRKHKKKANEYFAKQIAAIGGLYKYAEITFHLILFPVPDKDTIVDAFVEQAEIYKKKICKK